MCLFVSIDFILRKLTLKNLKHKFILSILDFRNNGSLTVQSDESDIGNFSRDKQYSQVIKLIFPQNLKRVKD